MERVDLTGIWRSGKFYKVQAIHDCKGCEFYYDGAERGRQCYDVLDCEDTRIQPRTSIYIKTDDISVAKYIQERMDYVPESI